MKPLIIFCTLLPFLHGCAQTPEQKSSNPENVGDIVFDLELDDPHFKVCNEQRVYQYYNFGKGMQYEGEKSRIEAHFKNKLREKPSAETGFVTFRFIVNCEGKTGRFRMQEMNNDYAPMKFSKNLTRQLLKLTKQLDGWRIGGNEKMHVDYYQYLTFKIENGELTEIMP
jgi:hypothetical protein